MNNNYSYPENFKPIDEKSIKLMQKMEFALIGISPFNSYFSTKNIFKIIKLVADNFSDYAVFVPDKISRYTLLALNYDEKRIAHKIRKQDNYLINKTNLAFNKLKQITKNELHNPNKIITLSSIKNNKTYIDSYKSCKNLFQNDVQFKEGCLNTSSWVLSAHKRGDTITLLEKEIAVEYFLKELPLFINAHEILNVNSCIFLYHNIPSFLKDIYKNYTITSGNTGFAIFKEL